MFRSMIAALYLTDILYQSRSTGHTRGQVIHLIIISLQRVSTLLSSGCLLASEQFSQLVQLLLTSAVEQLLLTSAVE